MTTYDTNLRLSAVDMAIRSTPDPGEHTAADLVARADVIYKFLKLGNSVVDTASQ